MSNMPHPPYPWGRWFKCKSAVTLFRGKDYRCQSHSMGQQVRNKAAEQGLRVSVNIADSSICFVVVRKDRP